MALLLILFASAGLIPHSQARTIVIPEEASSIQQAVELAANGDEIVVATDTVKWTYRLKETYSVGMGDPGGIVVKDKNLTIRGSQPLRSAIVTFGNYYEFSDDSTMLWVENGTVTLTHLYLEAPAVSRYSEGMGFTGAPFHVESGTLAIEDCDLSCAIECKGNLRIHRSTLRGYSWHMGRNQPYGDHTLSTPSIRIGPSVRSEVVIRDATVTGQTLRSHINLLVQDVQDGSVSLLDSRFIGGTAQHVYGSGPGERVNGSHGLHIKDCTGTVFHLSQSTFHGGDGYDAGYLRHGIVQHSGVGGSGLFVQDARIRLTLDGERNRFAGGPGGRAFAGNQDYIHEMMYAPASVGGHGMVFLNSHVHYQGPAFDQGEMSRGGPGGEAYQLNDITLAPGPDGFPVYIDESSMIEPISSITDWNLF